MQRNISRNTSRCPNAKSNMQNTTKSPHVALKKADRFMQLAQPGLPLEQSSRQPQRYRKQCTGATATGELCEPNKNNMRPCNVFSCNKEHAALRLRQRDAHRCTKRKETQVKNLPICGRARFAFASRRRRPATDNCAILSTKAVIKRSSSACMYAVDVV